MILPGQIKKNNSNLHVIFLIIFLIFIAYSNSFYSPWHLDDAPNILNNPGIHLKQLSFSHLWQTAFAHPSTGNLYRPVACVTLALNWFFGQDNVFGYHVVNFLIHCCAIGFLFFVINLLFFTPRLCNRYSPKQAHFIAVTATLFWALNPIHVQAITYIVQRMASMAAMFSLLAILCYLKARLTNDIRKQSAFFFVSLLSYFLAFFSKQNAVTVVLILPVIEVLFFQRTLSRSLVYKIAGSFIVVCFLSLLIGIILHHELFNIILKGYADDRPFTLYERVLTEPRIVLYYLSQIFFPAPGRLSIEHDIILSTSFLNPWTTLPVIIVCLLLIVLAVKMSRKQPLFSLSILFFFLNHLVESTIIPLELVFEHRNYLPSVFLFLPLAQFINFIFIKVKKNKLITTSITLLLALVFAVEGYATYIRNQAWQTESGLWLDALTKAPNSSRPLETLAIELAWGSNPTKPKLRKALELNERALTLRMSQKTRSAVILSNMAMIYTKLGKYKKAEVYYEKSLKIAPDYASNRYHFSKNLIMTGDFDRARVEAVTLLNKGFLNAKYYYLLGFIDLWAGQPEQALSITRKAMKSNPLQPDTLLLLGKCFSHIGYYVKAQWYFSLAKKMGRKDAIVSLCIIENALRDNKANRAQEELKYVLKRLPLEEFFNTLHVPPDKQYREVPLDNEILIPFIQGEVFKIYSQLASNTTNGFLEN